jgi:hypothetical protein
MKLTYGDDGEVLEVLEEGKKLNDSVDGNQQTVLKKRHRRKESLTSEYKPDMEALEYLEAFGTEKWKFNKRKQIWLLRNMYKVTPDEFRMLMGYMKNMGERAKEETREQARAMLERDGIYYKRAKKILRYI